MLLITRRVGEKIMVGDDVVVHVMEIVGNTVRVGIQAPRSIAGLPRGDLARRPRGEPRRGRRRAVRASAHPPPTLTAASRRGRTPGTVLAWTLPRPPATLRLPTSPSPSRATASRQCPGRAAAQAAPRRQDPADRRRRRRRRRRAAVQARQAVRGLLPGGTSETAPARRRPTRRRRSPTTTPPVRSRTPRPPCPSRPRYEEPAIDEAAEEAAAAAEAANIGGPVSDYAGPEGELATRPSARWPRPARASPRARSRPRPSCARPPRRDGMSPEQAQIDDAIDAGRQPARGRDRSSRSRPGDDSEWNTWSGRAIRVVPSRSRSPRETVGRQKLTRAMPASATIGSSS